MTQLKSHPCLKNHSLIKEICTPLADLGVHFFGYTALDESANAYCLGSRANYAEEYLNRNHVKKDILVQPKVQKLRDEYDFWDYKDLDANQKELYKMAADFDQSHTVSITKQYNNLSHSFHFSGQVADDGFNQRMLEKMDSLHLFIDVFKEKLTSVKELNEIYQYSTSVDPSAIAQNRNTTLIRESISTMDLEKLGHNTLNFTGLEYFSESERETLRWLAMGKSAQMISEIKGLSRKTIERNIAAIKEKLGCYTLFQMGMTVAESGLSRFLPRKPLN